MKKIRPSFIVCAILILAIAVVAQSQLSSWPFYVEIAARQGPGVYQLTVPLQVMGQSRDDLGDLRLFDSENREVPYAIRTRASVNERREFTGHVFNQVTVGSDATEATVDLGDSVTEHNQVQIQTTGTDFRRRVVVEGSDSRSDWKTLASDGFIFSFHADGKTAASDRVSYPTSRYKYLRVRVYKDEVTDDDVPNITGVQAVMGVYDKGQLTTWTVHVPAYQLIRNQGAHAAQWTIDLGSRVPCDRLSLTIADPSFYRPFELENFDDPQNPRLIANGYISRRAGEEQKPVMITFGQEQHARKLRLQITDYSNQTLTIQGIEASAPARELVFEVKQPQPLPLRLFFGNAKVPEPHYDFEKELATKLKSPVKPGAVGLVTTNSAYTPEPLPFTERAPWLIYLVLAASSITLGWILWSLARTALGKGSIDQAEGSAHVLD
jgi:hypothetical protein